jgi:hypothetical protein
MIAMSSLILAVIALAGPVFGQPIQPCSTPARYYTVNELTTFTPSTGNTEPGRLSFYIGNTSCSSKTVLNPKVAQTCTDASYDYLWDGKSLTVRETFTPCAKV